MKKYQAVFIVFIFLLHMGPVRALAEICSITFKGELNIPRRGEQLEGELTHSFDADELSDCVLSARLKLDQRVDTGKKTNAGRSPLRRSISQSLRVKEAWLSWFVDGDEKDAKMELEEWNKSSLAKNEILTIKKKYYFVGPVMIQGKISKK